jgi:tetratricopeptide (TPR) repeat protein
VSLDGGLGNAWLGLGLTKIKQGHIAEGRSDLQTAATVEPTRSFFYSYHGKALALANAPDLARKDLTLARQIDPQDPTPWLYSALLLQQGNHYNAAIDSMTESVRRNDNRQVYRSRFLLDQDRAVRSSNLATIYRNNGMVDVSVREATRAVQSDYANASSHLFLANSFDALRDPNRLLLRYETAWFNEKLLADLLAPVGGGPLSQFVSQQEYSKLFESDGVGGNLVAEAREHGYVDVVASGYANYGRFGTGVDFLYHNDDGSRPNSDARRKEFFWQAKFQPAADDILYALVKWQTEEGGDIYRKADVQSAKAGLRYTDDQRPGLALAGWNHRWAPGIHTLLLVGRQAAATAISQPSANFTALFRRSSSLSPGFLRPTSSEDYEYTAPELRNAPTPPVTTNPDGSLHFSADFLRLIAPYLGKASAQLALVDQLNQNSGWDFTISSAELQQIWQTEHHTLLVGSRAQSGEFRGDDRLTVTRPDQIRFYQSAPSEQHVSVPYSRASVYLYEFFKITPTLTLIAGATYDHLEHPANVLLAPVNDHEMTVSRANAKLGFTYAPSRSLEIRGVYLEAVGGASFDESVRLEPAQIAGFNQAFRSVISEALVDTVQAPVYHIAGLSVEGSSPMRTWWGLSFQRTAEDVEREVGTFDFFSWAIAPFAYLPAGTPQKLEYWEEVGAATVDQLIGDQFAVGLIYRRTRAHLHQRTPLVAAAANPDADRTDNATLDELSLHAVWNSPWGWFAGSQVAWRQQDASTMPRNITNHDDFVQVDVWTGRRFRQNQCEISAGVQNLTDQDYYLNPLTYVQSLPHERTFFLRCRLGF